MIGKRRLSPSKAGWMVGDKVDCTYPKSCLRYTVWERRYEKESDIDPLYTAMGAIDEERLTTILTRDKIPFKREVEIDHPIAGSIVKIQGRLDFLIETVEPRIIEKKSVISPTRTKSIVINGNIDPSHLAQILTYMAVSKIGKGTIHVTAWSWSQFLDALVATGDREFQIELSPTGEIAVDGKPYPGHIRQIQQWFRSAATAMENAETELPNRPVFKQGWQNPCNKCPLKDACAQYDVNKNVQMFWQETQSIEPESGPKANIPTPKQSKGKKNEFNQVSNSINPSNDSGRISDKAGIVGREVHSRAGDLFADGDGD